MSITFTQRELGRQRIRSWLNGTTREPRGSEQDWQHILTEYDADLHLRFSFVREQYLICYDHHGILEVIRAFRPGESFRCAFENVRHNATLNRKRLTEMLTMERHRQDMEIDRVIDDADRELKTDVDRMNRRVVTTDGVKDNDY